jgi:hypothetical protein
MSVRIVLGMMNEDVYICDMTRAAGSATGEMHHAESGTGEMHAKRGERHHLHADKGCGIRKW